MSSTTGGVVPQGTPPAPIGRRVAAFLVDGALTSLVAAPLWAATLPAATATLRAAGASGTAVPAPAPPSVVLLTIGTLLLVAWGVVQWVCHGTRGWTVGRRLLGLRTVDVRSGRPIGLGRALVRALVVAAGALACGIGQLVVLLSPLFDSSGRRRGWHDRVGEAVVVDVRGLAAARRVAAWDERPASPTSGAAPAWPATGALPHPALPGDPGQAAAPAPGPGRPSVDPTPSEPTRTRWSALAADRRLDAPDLVLPPLGTPGLGPDLDTRQIPVVPAAVVPAHPADPVPLAAAPAPGPVAPAPAPAPPAPAEPAPPAPSALPGWPADPSGPVPGSPSAEQAAWSGALGPAAGPAGGPAAGSPAGSPGSSAEPSTRTGRHAIVPPAPVHPDALPTATGPVPPAAPAPAPPVPAAPPASPAPTGPPAPPASVPGAALPPEPFPAPAPAPVAGGAGWAVRLPDGTVAALDGPLLIGRNPDPQAGVRTVAVADPARSVSKTHLMVGVDEHGPWVVDRGSTNGTLVTLADGQRIVCLPDRRVRLADGSVVTFGDLALAVGLRG